ncbi:MAG: TIGR04372 family glycosyltransferase [bacterium]
MTLILKILKKIVHQAAVFSTFPIILFVRLIRPILTVRFGYFTVDRVGHFVFDVGYFLTEYGIRSIPRTRDYFFLKGASSNEYFETLTKRYIRISPLSGLLYEMNQMLPGGDIHCIEPARERVGSRDLHGTLADHPKPLEFDSEDNRCGMEFLAKTGCGGKKFVCFLVRDSAYLSKLNGQRDWSYHDHRDSDINDFEVAATNLAKKGYFVFRMGKAVRKPFQVQHPMIMDYALSEYRSDFLDIWLMANCRFAVSTGTGIDAVANIWKKPVVYVNFLPALDYVSFFPNITLFKKLKWAESGEKLSLTEMLQHSYGAADDYRNSGIEVEGLTPTEIADAVEEMENRVTGMWGGSSADRQRAVRIWAIFQSAVGFNKFHAWHHPDAGLGAKFLQTNEAWFCK